MSLMDTLVSKQTEGLREQQKESDSSWVSPGMKSVTHLEAHLWPESDTVSTLLCKQSKSKHASYTVRNGTVTSSQRLQSAQGK